MRSPPPTSQKGHRQSQNGKFFYCALRWGLFFSLRGSVFVSHAFWLQKHPAVRGFCKIVIWTVRIVSPVFFCTAHAYTHGHLHPSLAHVQECSVFGDIHEVSNTNNMQNKVSMPHVPSLLCSHIKLQTLFSVNVLLLSFLLHSLFSHFLFSSLPQADSRNWGRRGNTSSSCYDTAHHSVWEV